MFILELRLFMYLFEAFKWGHLVVRGREAVEGGDNVHNPIDQISKVLVGSNFATQTLFCVKWVGTLV